MSQHCHLTCIHIKTFFTYLCNITYNTQWLCLNTATSPCIHIKTFFTYLCNITYNTQWLCLNTATPPCIHIKTFFTYLDVEITVYKCYKVIVQGHMLTCWEIMLIYGTNVFLAQKSLLIKKNFGANFSENVHYVFFYIYARKHIFC